MLYFIIIVLTMLFVHTYSMILSLNGVFTLTEAFWGPIIINLNCIFILAIVSLLLRICIPVRKFNYNSNFFMVRDSEMQFLNKINVKKWKNKIPELGKLGNFTKKNIQSFEEKYLQTFLHETCFGEFLHLLVGVLSFSILFFIPIKAFIYSLPILLVNLVLHILPCLVQRYVRFKLVRIYNYKFQCKKVQ